MNTQERLSQIKAKKYVILHLKKELARYENELVELEDLE